MTRSFCLLFAIIAITSVAPGFATAQVATQQGNPPVVEIRIQSSRDKQKARQSIPGFQIIDQDLDEGMSGWGALRDGVSSYIYLFYRTSWNEKPITGLMISEQESPGYTKIRTSLNTFGSGDNIHLCYTTDPGLPPITGLSVRHEERNIADPGWSRVNVNLNKGGGRRGANLYLWYRRNVSVAASGDPVVEIRIQSVRGKSAATRPIPGFKMIDQDLDEGMSGWGTLREGVSNHIYLFYRTSRNEKPITGLNIFDGQAPPGFTKISPSLNTFGSGANIHLYYTTNVGLKPITDIRVLEESQRFNAPGWKRIDVNLNKGGGRRGVNLYLWYKQESDGGSSGSFGLTDSQQAQTIAGITIGTRTSGTSLEAQSMRNYQSGSWTNGDQLFWGAKAVNDRLDILVDAPSPGTYFLYAKLTKAPDFGIFSFRRGTTEIGRQDLYAANVAPMSTGLAPIGRFTVNTSGRHAITVQVVGKNPQSRGYKFGIDTIAISPVERRTTGGITPQPPRNPSTVRPQPTPYRNQGAPNRQRRGYAP